MSGPLHRPVHPRRNDLVQADAGVREVWIELVARLTHTHHECGRTDAVMRLKRYGVRRTGTAAVNLRRELAQAVQIARSTGLELDAEDIQRRCRGLSSSDDLDQDFRGLAQAYLQLLQVLHPPAGSPLQRWLQGRARLHAVQADAVSRGP